MLEFSFRADESTTKCQCDISVVCHMREKVGRLLNFAVKMDINGLIRNEVGYM